jgi:Ca2+-binding EF-hand superfamily protein
VFEAPTSADGVFQSEVHSHLTVPFRRPVSPQSEQKLKEIIQRLKAYGKHHGADPKSWFYDFDKNNKGILISLGWVNYNQFRRGMPQNLISPGEEDLLLARYGDPGSETVNYFQLHTDVTRKEPRVRAPEQQLVAKQKTDAEHVAERLPIGTEEVLSHHYGTKNTAIEEIEGKIKQFVYRNRLRLVEFFKDYDKHNCGLITQSQFITGSRLARLPVENHDVDVLVRKYIIADGRVNYRHLCNSIDTIFTMNDLERNPLGDVKPPNRDWLIQSQNKLSASEEEHLQTVIVRLQKYMKERRILLAPYFKDYEKNLGNMGKVTKSHFSRLMHSNGFLISEDDLHILFKKFEDRLEGRINYMEFIRCIDPETYPSYQNKRETSPSSQASKDVGLAIPTDDVNTEWQILATKIQTYFGSKRIQLSQYFKEFQKLRCFSIKITEFERIIYKIGLHLSTYEMQLLTDRYKEPNKAGYCNWKKFEQEVAPDVSLEKLSLNVNDQISPFAGTGSKLNEREEMLLQSAMEKIRSHLRFRKPSIKAFFRDCDKICSGIGHVTKSQLRQCLTFMECYLPEEEFEVICKKWQKHSVDPKQEFNYINDVGKNICYILFLEELEKGMKSEDEIDEYEHVPLKKKVQSPQPMVQVTSHTDFEKLMMKIKTKAKTERIRVLDFMRDFDHLRHGKILRNEFRRALKVVFTNLTESDLQNLESKYAGPNGTVRYVDFSDDVESVFTKKGLEKNPTDVPEIFDVYSNGWETDTFINNVSSEDEIILKEVMKRFHERVLQRKVDALSYMEDYDFVKEGFFKLI